MEKHIPLKPEHLSAEEEEQCRITSAREIEIILQHIAKNQSRIALYYGNDDAFIITTLLAADKNGIFVEQADKEFDNGNIEHSANLLFVGVQAQVKIQFVISNIKRSNYDGYPAFQFMLPPAILRIQRREHYRLTTPAEAPLFCNIIPDSAPAKRLSGLTIMNISGGGIGLVCAKTDIPLEPGQTYRYQLNLPNIGTIQGIIEVKNTIPDRPEQEGHYVGCEFKNLDRQSTLLLQRYITEMQRKK